LTGLLPLIPTVERACFSELITTPDPGAPPGTIYVSGVLPLVSLLCNCLLVSDEILPFAIYSFFEDFGYELSGEKT